MKMENKRKAQEQRAQERARKAAAKRRNTILMFAVPALLVLGVVIWIVVYSVGNMKTEDAQSAGMDTSTITSEDSEADFDIDAEDEEDTAAYVSDADAEIKEGDTVNIDYVGYIGDEAFDGGNTEGNGADLTIGSHTYIDDFEEQLIGHKVGDNVDVVVTFPEDYGQESLAGKEATFKVVINGIYE